MFLKLKNKTIELDDIKKSTDLKWLESTLNLIQQAQVAAESQKGLHYENEDAKKLFGAKAFIKQCKFFKNAILLKIQKEASDERKLKNDIPRLFIAFARQILDTESFDTIMKLATNASCNKA